MIVIWHSLHFIVEHCNHYTVPTADHMICWAKILWLQLFYIKSLGFLLPYSQVYEIDLNFYAMLFYTIKD